jgi:hypothetical protein
MASMIVIEELADLIGRDDPEVALLVENANLYPGSRDGALKILQAMLKEKGLNAGKRYAFGAPSVMPGNGRLLGHALCGDVPHGPYLHPAAELPGNMGVFGGCGTGKSSLVGLLCEGWFEGGLRVIVLDVADEYGWLIHRYPVEKLLVLRARRFPLGVFVNPVGSCLSPLAWLSLVIGVLRECMYLRDGSCNLLYRIAGAMYRERGVLEGSDDYPLATDVFQKLVTSKFSVQSRHAGFLETLVNRFHGLLQSFPGMNAKRSLLPEQVTGRSLIIRMADLSPGEIDVFTGLMLAWLMAHREGKI